MIKIKNLNILFNQYIFKNAHFYASKGQIISIDGQSGSGKTTFLKYILNNVKPETGKLYFQDRLINEDNWSEFLYSHVSYVSQMGDFYPNMTIKQHFDFYSQLYKLELNEDIIKELLQSVNLFNVDIKKSPIKLSTGERKRFLIALALYVGKDIILLDEPTASIDYQSKEILLDVLKKISKQGITIIIATHDQSVLDISDNVFTITNCELIAHQQNINNKETSLIQDKQIHKTKYRKFKNTKLRLLFMIILLVGSLCVSFISQTISLTTALNVSKSLETKNYQNNKLYLFKTIDPNNPLDSVNVCDYGPNGEAIDIIGKDELENIKKLDGVKNILPVVMTDASNQGIEIEIFKNNEPLRKVKSQLDVGVESLMKTSLVITGYYPEENITKEGKKIDGIYINDSMKEILNLEDYQNITIRYTQRFPACLAKEESKFKMWPLSELHEVSIPIDGVLLMSDYYDGRLNGCARIYMPVQQLESLMKQYYNTEEYEDSDLEISDYQYRAQMIICEDGKDEDVKLAIENMDPSYKARSDYLTDKEYVNYMRKQTNSSVLLMGLSSLALLSATTALIIYYLNIRKKEMLLLKNDGLKKSIRKYYREDNYTIVFVWFVVSMIALWLYYLWILPTYTQQVSKELFVIVWICATSILLFIICFIKEKFAKRYIERVD